MDYKGQVCPVCNKTFEKDDDIVVCPVCGTPQHRECYDSLGHCVNLNRHRENYDYQREQEVNRVEEEELICNFCSAVNPANSKFCNSCGKPLNINPNAYTQTQQNGNNQNAQNPQPPFGTTFVMDPLGGVKADEDLGEGVKAGEAAKFVKATTPYYIPQFKQIKERNRARFSFVGFIFGGGWMLYRKMYKLGAVFTAILALLTLGDLYISIYHESAVSGIQTLYNEMLSNMAKGYGFNMYSALADFFTSLTTEQIIICLASTAISVLMIAIRVICGLFANRWYYKHTIKTVSKIKNSSANEQELNEKLSTRGGVNVPLAISLIASYYILIYLPMFF